MASSNIFWTEFASKPFKLRIILSTIFGQLLIFLDVLGVVFAATLISLILSEFQGSALPSSTIRLISLMGITDLRFDTQFIIIGVLSVLFLILKSALTTILIFYNFNVLAKEAVRLENELTTYVLEVRDYTKNRDDNVHKLIYALTSGVENLVVVRFGSQINIASDITAVLVLLIFLLSRELMIGSMLIFILLITFFILERTINRKSRNYGEFLYKGLTSVSQKIHEGLMMQREFKVWNIKNPKILEALPVRKELAITKGKNTILPNISKHVIEIMIMILMVAISSISLLNGSARNSIEAIVLLFLVSSRAIPALLRIQNSLVTIKNVEGSSSFTIELLHELKRSIRDKLDFGLVESGLEVKNVSFRYPNAKQDIIKSFSFVFNPAEIIGIVGKTGSGKSTLVNILMGLLKSNQGEIRVLNNFPKVGKITLSPANSYVPQDSFIFGGTVRDNVLCGRDYSDSQVRIALRIAEFNLRGISDEKILDYGLELSGTNLSGGEKQRLAIARGVLGKPTLIVLDEATSALDVETESKILVNLDSYLPSHSIKIIVTHRVESLKRANKIIVVNKKRIATYESLSEMKLSMFQAEKK